MKNPSGMPSGDVTTISSHLALQALALCSVTELQDTGWGSEDAGKSMGTLCGLQSMVVYTECQLDMIQNESPSMSWREVLEWGQVGGFILNVSTPGPWTT